MIDFNSKLGRKAKRLLDSEYVIWLTTLDSKLTPQPRPVWFVWDGDAILIYSQPATHKLKHIKQHPNVSLHFNTDREGGEVIVLTGTASPEAEKRPAHEVAAYVKKYKKGMAELDMTPQQFSQSYSQGIRVKLNRLRGF